RPSLSERYLRRLEDALSRIAKGYRLVLIDCPPSLNGLTRTAWSASNRVAVGTEPSLFSVAAADRALRATDELRQRGASELQPLGLVVNRVRAGSTEHDYRIQEMREMFGPLVLNPPLAERAVMQQAQGSARPIHSWPGRPAERARASRVPSRCRPREPGDPRTTAVVAAMPGPSPTSRHAGGTSRSPRLNAERSRPNSMFGRLRSAFRRTSSSAADLGEVRS